MWLDKRQLIHKGGETVTMYRQETILAMELNRSHVGRLVQIITEGWSMTGTLTRVDQHDNREWEIIYPDYGLRPSGGEIYTTLNIGPWVGRVIGNQPVTVETVAGTLEAPERALEGIQPGQIADLFEVPVELVDPNVISGTIVEPGEVLKDVHAYGAREGLTLCGLMRDGGGPAPDGYVPPRRSRFDYDRSVTCPACLERLY